MVRRKPVAGLIVKVALPRIVNSVVPPTVIVTDAAMIVRSRSPVGRRVMPKRPPMSITLATVKFTVAR